MNLQSLGWNPFFANAFATFAKSGYSVGRVVLEHKNTYWLLSEHGEIQAMIAGRLRYQATGKHAFPAIGDWVVIKFVPGEGKAVIHAILPRKSKFSRKAAGDETTEQIVAANVDNAFLVVGLDVDFNLRRIERYLIDIRESGANPVVILNKADICKNVSERARETESVALGVTILITSAKAHEGLEAVGQFLSEGQTVALIGSSGVGKSTIINALVGENLQKTQEVHFGSGRGRHATTRRELIVLPSGGMVIDTPGMRELQLWSGREGIQETFEDIESVAKDCYFRDCRHENEPNCAVKEAMAAGHLSPQRLTNYLKMQKELILAVARQNQRLKLEEKQRVKRVTKAFNRAKSR